MAEPTLGQVFGVNASSDAIQLTVSKGDMAAVGYTNAGSAGRAEPQLVSILLIAAQNLTEENRLTDLVNRNVTIVYSGQDLVNQGGGNVFLRDTYQISLYKATAVVPIAPDNY